MNPPKVPVSTPDTSASRSRLAFQLGWPGSRYLSGRKVGITRPDHVSSSRRNWCGERSSQGSSVVASTLDAELFVEGPRFELLGSKTLSDLIIDLVRSFGAGSYLYVEDVGQLRLHPKPHRSPAVDAPVPTKNPESLARLLLSH